MKDVLLERRDATKEKITWQICSERKGIFTLNEEDLYSYKADFVSACKGALSVTLTPKNRPAADPTDPTISVMGSVRGYFHGRRDDQYVIPLVLLITASPQSLTRDPWTTCLLRLLTSSSTVYSTLIAADSTKPFTNGWV